VGEGDWRWNEEDGKMKEMNEEGKRDGKTGRPRKSMRRI